MDASAFEVIKLGKSAWFWGRSAKAPKVTLKVKTSPAGTNSYSIAPSAGARHLIGLEVGQKVEFLKNGTVISIRKTSDNISGLKLIAGATIGVNKIIEGLGLEVGVYPVYAEGGALYFDSKDLGLDATSLATIEPEAGL
ncbi:MAG: hypothetical protein ACYC63_04695 [Armatimonadota bacterium]